ncbi:hypothetical protein NIES21_27300 [Anabaenopsis circularis NIES-21]|uniref:Uncharacterized protein n=1 Tax=Anabaenopsis circularis NIES-21 TaxID=1085406 RepID=A0A1Z4GHR5_9CYAN|nr:hypothetical protein NIES21_27300 [Anabaenopsis circularis NIES-21]
MISQLSLFNLDNYTNYNPEEEPPDPGDYQTLEAYEYAWKQWEKKFPHLVAETQAMTVLEQDTTVPAIISDDSQKIAGDRQLVVLEQDTSNPVPEQPVPEHLQWVEKYSPSKRPDNHYYRYCYKVARKIQHRHIPGGNVRSSIALARKQAIEEAIADGKSPADIEKLIRSWRNHRS